MTQTEMSAEQIELALSGKRDRTVVWVTVRPGTDRDAAYFGRVARSLRLRGYRADLRPMAASL